MAMIDPEKERKRLAEVYAGMGDEELQRVADQGWSLTDIGHEALTAELAKRSLSISLNDIPPPIEVPEKRELVLIRRYRDLPEAILAKGMLDSANIECFLVDETVVRMDWFWSTLLGGIKLMVDSANTEEAIAVLGQPIPETLDVEGVGEYKQPTCPECGSLDVSFEELNKGVAYTTAYLNLPLPIHRTGWRCHMCGHHWLGDDGQSAA